MSDFAATRSPGFHAAPSARPTAVSFRTNEPDAHDHGAVSFAQVLAQSSRAQPPPQGAESGARRSASSSESLRDGVSDADPHSPQSAPNQSLASGTPDENPQEDSSSREGSDATGHRDQTAADDATATAGDSDQTRSAVSGSSQVSADDALVEKNEADANGELATAAVDARTEPNDAKQQTVVDQAKTRTENATKPAIRNLPDAKPDSGSDLDVEASTKDQARNPHSDRVAKGSRFDAMSSTSDATAETFVKQRPAETAEQANLDEAKSERQPIAKSEADLPRETHADAEAGGNGESSFATAASAARVAGNASASVAVLAGSVDTTTKKDEKAGDTSKQSSAFEMKAFGSTQTSGETISTEPSRGQPSGADNGDVSTADRIKLIQRVAKAFQHLGPDGGAVRLRLAPAELGTVRLEMQFHGKKLAARLVTDTEAAGELIREQLTDLRGRLESLGMQVERIDVEAEIESEDSGRNPTDRSMRDGEEQRQSQPPGRNLAGEKPSTGDPASPPRRESPLSLWPTTGVDLHA